MNKINFEISNMDGYVLPVNIEQQFQTSATMAIKMLLISNHILNLFYVKKNDG